MKDKNRSNTCLKCGADITRTSTHTLMDCIEHLRSENEVLREQIERLNRAAAAAEERDENSEQ